MTNKQDFIIDHESELWIRQGNGYPQAYSITFVERVSSTSIILFSSVPLTLYHGDVLLFDTTLVVIAQTFTFSWDVENQIPLNTTVAVLPLVGTIAQNTIAHTYALIPVYSIHTHSVNQEGSTVTNNNKELGLWTKHFVNSKSCDISCSGFFIRDDRGFHLLYDTAQGSGFIFFELRYNPYVTTNIGTVRANGSVHLSDNSNPVEFVDVNFTIKVKGTPQLYTPLKLSDMPFYCPFNPASYYKIDFKVIPDEDTVNYCPQNIDGWYDFTTNP